MSNKNRPLHLFKLKISKSKGFDSCYFLIFFTFHSKPKWLVLMVGGFYDREWLQGYKVGNCFQKVSYSCHDLQVPARLI